MERGDLVSDDLIVDLIRERIAQADARRGFILDGFPRTIAQAEALERLLAEGGDSLSAAVNFRVPDEELTRRMLGRAAEEGRADDRPETIRERLRIYREKTEPLVAFYRKRDLVADVDGVGTVDEIGSRLDAALMSLRRAGAAS
jgi:adenylate kinase